MASDKRRNHPETQGSEACSSNKQRRITRSMVIALEKGVPDRTAVVNAQQNEDLRRKPVIKRLNPKRKRKAKHHPGLDLLHEQTYRSLAMPDQGPAPGTYDVILFDTRKAVALPGEIRHDPSHRVDMNCLFRTDFIEALDKEFHLKRVSKVRLDEKRK
ncbi:hypothetical protein Ocin01_16915 [Orchesella cincta]|uniref:Uncharacterized protein n=1 Tax=Orchesella cincta TaxID=48709 RepID=A0A1D2M9V5_ORCCI|nr:hypothetical protein Ocin01_16915 [Orchesella cincta]